MGFRGWGQGSGRGLCPAETGREDEGEAGPSKGGVRG